MAAPVQLLAVIQAGRLAHEALLFMASWARQDNRGFEVILAEPQPGPLWESDPRVHDPEIRGLLRDMGAEIRPFETRIWGSRYPQGNKIEALRVLDPARAFIFFDTDTLFMRPLAEAALDFSVPNASWRVAPTWPRQKPGDAPARQVWERVYSGAGMVAPQAAPYFNAGVFYAEKAGEFADIYAEIATGIEATPPAGQALYPWLDQIALPLVLARLGGPGAAAPAGIDGAVTCHWRTLPLLYAREADAVVDVLEAVAGAARVKRLLRRWEPARRMIYRGEGHKARALFADGVPEDEAAIRRRLKAEGLWIR